MVSAEGGKSQYTVEKSNYECQEFGKYLMHLKCGYRGDKNIFHLGMRSVSTPWDYQDILPFSDRDVKLLEALNPRLDPTVMPKDPGTHLTYAT